VGEAQTTAPVITAPVIAGATSVSGIAVAGSSVILSIGGTAQPAVTASGTGAWTVTGLTAITAGQSLTATAQTTGETVSASSTVVIVGEAQTPSPTQTSVHYGGGSGRTDYWVQSGNTEDNGNTGPAPPQAISNPTPLPTVQQTVSDPVTASSTEPPLPTDTPKSGLDAVPALGAIALCGAIYLFRKNKN
jgi:hypothetical protein